MRCRCWGIIFAASYSLTTNFPPSPGIRIASDIVIPGFFLALLLRFDAHNANLPYFPTDCHASFPKPYFHSALVAYVAGLATTLFVMIQFNAAQPALLYLVPACLGSSLLCALVRGELKELFAYSEEEEEEEEVQADTKKDAAAKKAD